MSIGPKLQSKEQALTVIKLILAFMAAWALIDIVF
jgi:hypothetical protein